MDLVRLTQTLTFNLRSILNIPGIQPFHVGAANRDPVRFENPTEMNPDRDRVKEHLGFGAGPHVCPGAFLARMETRVAFDAFLDRVASFELAPSYRPDQNPVFWANGPQSLEVVLERA